MIADYAVKVFAAAATLVGQSAFREIGKDAYTKLRELLGKKTDADDLAKLEKSPESQARQNIIVEELNQLSPEEATVLYGLAQKLNELLNEHHSETAKAFEVNLLRAKIDGSVNISNNEIDGNASINAKDTTVGHDFNVEGNKVKKGSGS